MNVLRVAVLGAALILACDALRGPKGDPGEAGSGGGTADFDGGLTLIGSGTRPPLDVIGNGASATAIFEQNGGAVVEIAGPPSTLRLASAVDSATNFARLSVSSGTYVPSPPPAVIRTEAGGTLVPQALQLTTQQTDGGANLGIFIDTNGKVGINREAPVAVLHVGGDIIASRVDVQGGALVGATVQAGEVDAGTVRANLVTAGKLSGIQMITCHAVYASGDPNPKEAAWVTGDCSAGGPPDPARCTGFLRGVQATGSSSSVARAACCPSAECTITGAGYIFQQPATSGTAGGISCVYICN